MKVVNEHNHAGKMLIYLISLFPAISAYAISSEFSLFTDTENARYMLSALAQSEAAVIAIVITVNIVAMQLGAAYSLRVARIFSDSLEFKIFVFLYVSALLYTLCILGNLESIPDAFIKIAYSLGVFSFTILIFHPTNILSKITEPSKTIERLSYRINEKNIKNGKNVIEPLIDIIKSSILRFDEITAELGLKAIGDRVEDILGTEKLEAEEKLKFVKEVNSYFMGVGRFAMNQNDENSPWIIFENIERIGKKAIERKLEEIAYRAAISLSILGNTAVRERFENLAQQAVIRLFGLGKTAIDGEIKNAVSIVRFLSVIRRNAFKYELKEIGYDAEMSLEQLRELAVKKENKNLVSYFNRIQKEYSEEQSGF